MLYHSKSLPIQGKELTLDETQEKQEIFDMRSVDD